MPPQQTHPNRITIVLLTVIALALIGLLIVNIQNRKAAPSSSEIVTSVDATDTEQQLVQESAPGESFTKTFQVYKATKTTTSYAVPPTTPANLTILPSPWENDSGTVVGMESLTLNGSLNDKTVLDGVEMRLVLKPTAKTFYFVNRGGDGNVVTYTPSTNVWANVPGTTNYSTTPFFTPKTSANGYHYVSVGAGDGCWSSQMVLVDIPSDPMRWLSFAASDDTVCESFPGALTSTQKITNVLNSLHFN